MDIKEAIETLKDYRKGDFVDDYKLCEAIDTVVKELEKPLPTDEEIVKEANEIGEKKSWPIGRQTGFVFGAKWIRNLMRKEATELP